MLGPSSAWTLGSLANKPADIVWLVVAVVFAAIAAR
jgi:hypothetical protein